MWKETYSFSITNMWWAANLRIAPSSEEVGRLSLLRAQVWQNRPVKETCTREIDTPKETYLSLQRRLPLNQALRYDKRDLHTCRKRPTDTLKSTYTYVQRDRQTCQKRPANMPKETWRYVKREIAHLSFLRATYTSKETCIYVKRDVQIFQKRPTYMSKRDLHFCQKRPTYMLKGTYMYFKRDLHIFQKTTCTCPKRTCSPKRSPIPYNVLLHLKPHSI